MDVFDRYSPYMVDDEPQSLVEELQDRFSGKKPTSIGEIDKLWVAICDAIEDDAARHHITTVTAGILAAYQEGHRIIARYEMILKTTAHR